MYGGFDVFKIWPALNFTSQQIVMTMYNMEVKSIVN